jgi:Flp pilus assembly protein TadB
MGRMTNSSNNLIKKSLTKSLKKDRVSLKCMLLDICRFKYSPSLLLILIWCMGLLYYLFAHLCLMNFSVWFRVLGYSVVTIALLKSLSHETHRYNRFKAGKRRFNE